MPSFKDLYMNFADVSVLLNASNSSTLVTEKLNTGLSLRAGLVWLIHGVELLWPNEGVASFNLGCALSVRSGLSAVPDLGDAGVITKMEYNYALATSGLSWDHGPSIQKYLPPVCLAAPEIHIYAKSVADLASLRGTKVEARILYTTEQLTPATYQEIAETWGQF